MSYSQQVVYEQYPCGSHANVYVYAEYGSALFWKVSSEQADSVVSNAQTISFF